MMLPTVIFRLKNIMKSPSSPPSHTQDMFLTFPQPLALMKIKISSSKQCLIPKSFPFPVPFPYITSNNNMYCLFNCQMLIIFASRSFIGVYPSGMTHSFFHYFQFLSLKEQKCSFSLDMVKAPTVHTVAERI